MKYEMDKNRCVQESHSADSPEDRSLPMKGKFVHNVQESKESKLIRIEKISHLTMRVKYAIYIYHSAA